MTEFCYKIFHFHDSENQGPNNDPYNFSQNIRVVLVKKIDFIGFAIFQLWQTS